MRTVILSLATAAAAVVATPALANEARVEARGGIIWGSGDSEAIAGVAAGYDWDLGGRVGAQIGEAGKLYAAASYQTKPCRFCEESISAGAGYQHSFGGNLYGKVEYRHFFVGDNTPDADAVLAGIGIKF